MLETIKQAAVDAVEAAKPAAFFFGKVESISPIEVRIEQKTVILARFLIVPEQFSRRTVHLQGEMQTETESGHQHTVRIDQEVAIASPLAVGDTVILARVQGGQRYLILDRVVSE